MKFNQLVIVCFGILCAATQASAQTFSTPFGPGSVANPRLSGGRGYVCSVDGNGEYRLSLSVMGPSGQTISAVYPSANADALRVLDRADKFGDSNLGDNLIFFKTPQGSAGFGSYTVTMQTADAMSATPFLNCLDSTFVCNFNTFLSDAIYLEVTNGGFSNLSFVARLIDFDGTVTESQETVAAGARRDFRVDGNIARAKYGNLIFIPESSFLLFGEDVSARVSHYRDGKLLDTEVCQPLIFTGNNG